MAQHQSESFATADLPAALFNEAERIAHQQNWTVAEAVTYLVKRGIDAQHGTERAVTQAYNAFMNASEQDREQAGKELIRSIFGSQSVA